MQRFYRRPTEQQGGDYGKIIINGWMKVLILYNHLALIKINYQATFWKVTLPEVDIVTYPTIKLLM